MVVLNRIYTRTGDAGETALGDGSRVPKTAARVESYGTVDELNSAIGLARLHAAGPTDAALARIQNDLFDLGADLCTPGFEADADAAAPAAAHRRRPGRRASRRRSTPTNAGLAPLRSFVLPGGTPLAAHLHLARTVCRRAERLTVGLAGLEPLNPEAVRYLNRLSDWLFVAARVANDGGAADVLWTPGLNR